MAGDNAQQIEDWNGVLGQRWAELQQRLDRMTGPFGEAALAAAAARSGERVIDIGCGCGDTALKLARTVGPKGAVLGVDVSKPMLEVARARAGTAGLSALEFSECDASVAALPDERDLLFSRFGVMFFDAPVPAFAHLRRALNDSGRLAFVCWQAPRQNLWASVPVAAAKRAIPVELPPADPHAPGPFAFSDIDRVRAILLEADFDDVTADAFEAQIYMGATPREAAEEAAKMGPLGRLAREVGEEHLPAMLDAVEAALEPVAARNGEVYLPGRTWVVTARAG